MSRSALARPVTDGDRCVDVPYGARRSFFLHSRRRRNFIDFLAPLGPPSHTSLPKPGQSVSEAGVRRAFFNSATQASRPAAAAAAAVIVVVDILIT